MTNNHNFNNGINFKILFDGSSNIKEFYSQSGQDIFILSALNGKKNGKFLDIGASWPKQINNTFLLENSFNWDGVLIEIDTEMAQQCMKERKSKVICGDATKVNYNEIFEELGGYVDYISLDIDGQPTMDVLNSLPLNGENVGVITFEHDSYRVGDKIKNESRKIFDKYGFIRVCEDVANNNNIYEDWYVSSKIYDEKLNILKTSKINWYDILFY